MSHFVRPHFEYASQVWKTYKIWLTNALENIQELLRVQSSTYDDLFLCCPTIAVQTPFFRVAGLPEGRSTMSLEDEGNPGGSAGL